MSKLYIGVDSDVESHEDVYVVRADNEYEARSKVIDQFAKGQIHQKYFREYVESKHGCDLAENFWDENRQDIAAFETNVENFFRNHGYAQDYLYYYFGDDEPDFDDNFYYEVSKNLASKTENWVTFTIKEVDV